MGIACECFWRFKKDLLSDIDIAFAVLVTAGTLYVFSVSGGVASHAIPIWLLYSFGVFLNLFFTFSNLHCAVWGALRSSINRSCSPSFVS